MARTDTRRFRGGKIIGSRTSYQRFDYNGPQSRAMRLREALADHLDMTPVPRRMDDTVRLYLRGRTVIAPEIIGDDEEEELIN